jgi:DNA-binding LytR/AlgR family response regulator
MRILLAIASIAALAACNPMELANQATKRAAKAVIVPVLAQNLPAPIAERAADCIIDAADPAELRALAADIGVSAGTQTVANISALALRPAAAQCMANATIPVLLSGI